MTVSRENTCLCMCRLASGSGPGKSNDRKPISPVYSVHFGDEILWRDSYIHCSNIASHYRLMDCSLNKSVTSLVSFYVHTIEPDF